VYLTTLIRLLPRLRVTGGIPLRPICLLTYTGFRNVCRGEPFLEANSPLAT